MTWILNEYAKKKNIVEQQAERGDIFHHIDFVLQIDLKYSYRCM